MAAPRSSRGGPVRPHRHDPDRPRPHHQEQLDATLDIQRHSGRRVGDILVELGALSSFELARVLADHLGVPFIDLRTKPPDPMLTSLLPEEVARRYDALAIARVGTTSS